MFKDIQNNVRGVCRLIIENEKGEVVVDKKEENTLNINFIWDMCRQQLVRTNVNKRKITPFGGVILTNSNVQKNAYLPCVLGDVAGYASLFKNGKSEESTKEGYCDTTEVKCMDGKFTFMFKWGPTKVLNNFNTVWLYGPNNGEVTENGGFNGLVEIATPNKSLPINSIVGCSNNSFIYCLSDNIIYKYKVVADNNCLYNFVEIGETTIENNYNTKIGAFNGKENCFVILTRNKSTENYKMIKMNINGEVLQEIDTDFSNLTASIVCVGNYIIVMACGVVKAYNFKDLSFIKNIDFGNRTYNANSTIYVDGTDIMLYIYDYNLTTMETKRTDIFCVTEDCNLTYINSFNFNSNARDGKTLYPITCLGVNILYDTYYNHFYNNHIFPCTQDIILNGGTGEQLTFNKPLGYAAKLIYEICFDFDDEEECENQNINPRAFQDMFLNMLLPSDKNLEGINSFGSFMVCDNEKNEGLTTAGTKKIGFANLYSKEKSIYLSETQGICDMSGCYINRKNGLLQLKYEFDYNVANGNITHVQTGANNMIITGMNNVDGRCYAPKKIAKFEEKTANDILNTYGHKVFFGDEGKCYFIDKCHKNTIFMVEMNVFDREYMYITSQSAKNAIVLENINLNNEVMHQVVYIASIKHFICVTEQKMYLYDENWCFIEHKELPFVNSSIFTTNNVTYHGGMQSMYCLLENDDNKYKIICYNFVDKEIKWEFEDFGYNIEKIEAMCSDDEYIYINCKCNINTLTSYYFLTYKITETGLKLETYNQSRQIVNGSIVWTRGFLGKHMFLETTSYKDKNEYPEDLDTLNVPINQSIFLSKATPYITATHMLNNDTEKTKDDFFEGIFQVKLI